MRLSGWLIIVLLASTVSVQADSLAIPVPAVAIKSGESLGDAQLVDRRMLVNEIAARTYVIDREQVTGLVARRPLQAFAPIPLSALRRPWSFKEGERVVVQFAAQGLSIRGSAIALVPGGIGDEVTLRNPDTGITIRGVVALDGAVSVEGNR